MVDEKLFTWLRWGMGIAVGVFIAVMITSYLSRDNLIAGCIRSGDSKIIDAKFFEGAALKNHRIADQSTGESVQINNQAADDYTRFAQQKRDTIPMPNGWHGDPDTRGDDAAERTRGCEDAYPPPIPFVR